jgi:integrase
MFPEGYAKGTVSHLMALYFEQHAGQYLKPRSLQNYVDTARRHIVPRLGYVPAETLSVPDVRNALSSISKTSPQMTRSFKKVLSAAFQFGLEHMPGIKINPCTGVRITVPKNKGSRWLTDEELSVFLAGIDGLEDRRSADVYTLILYSLCRPNEAFGLRAEDVIRINGEKVLRIPASRNKSREDSKRDFLIPLIGPIGEIIERRSVEVNGKGPLFWTYKGVDYPYQLKESNKAIRSLLGLEDIRPHDLRRTGRTHLPSLGVSEKVAEACLNHVPGEIEGTYNLYSYWNERKQALTLWHHKLETLRGKHVMPVPR